MLAATADKPRRRRLGCSLPRIGPPRPLKHDAKALISQADELGVPFLPWQETAARFIEARGPAGWLFPEVAINAGRQNGKTWILKPHIIRRLRMGRRILHSAQDRQGVLRDVYMSVADEFEGRYRDLLAKPIRYANGQEEIRLKNGGRYRIVAPTRSAARGTTNDDLILDEICELEDLEFVEGAAVPSVSSTPDSQILYTSNAGTPESVVLQSLRARAEGGDPALAWLEWSADPERAADDLAGWCEANPCLGHVSAKLPFLERKYRAAVLGNTVHEFEREYLCRMTVARRELLVKPEEWADQAFEGLAHPPRSAVAIKMDNGGERAGEVAAWQLPDKRIALSVLADVTGSPVDVDRVGPAFLAKSREWRAAQVGYDPYTDADLARHFRSPKPILGRHYANASEGFARRVRDRQFVVADPTGCIADDLTRTVRHASSNGAYIAVKAGEGTNAVAEAAIRAAWLAVQSANGLMVLG